jgi:hypothetical protein
VSAIILIDHLHLLQVSQSLERHSDAHCLSEAMSCIWADRLAAVQSHLPFFLLLLSKVVDENQRSNMQHADKVTSIYIWIIAGLGMPCDWTLNV